MFFWVLWEQINQIQIGDCGNTNSKLIGQKLLRPRLAAGVWSGSNLGDFASACGIWHSLQVDNAGGELEDTQLGCWLQNCLLSWCLGRNPHIWSRKSSVLIVVVQWKNSNKALWVCFFHSQRCLHYCFFRLFFFSIVCTIWV